MQRNGRRSNKTWKWKKTSMQLGLIRDTLNKEILLYKESISKKKDEIKNILQENEQSIRLKNKIISDLNNKIAELNKKNEMSKFMSSNYE